MMNKAIISLKYELKNVSYNIDSLQTMTKNIMDKLSSINSLPQSQDSDEYNATFADTLWPIQNTHELNEQERLLKEDQSERNIIVSCKMYNAICFSHSVKKCNFGLNLLNSKLFKKM